MCDGGECSRLLLICVGMCGSFLPFVNNVVAQEPRASGLPIPEPTRGSGWEWGCVGAVVTHKTACSGGSVIK